jgi:hypothetical protein
MVPTVRYRPLRRNPMDVTLQEAKNLRSFPHMIFLVDEPILMQRSQFHVTEWIRCATEIPD